jgi:polysaccharide export outer membrane protein
MITSCVPIQKIRYFNDTNELEEPGANPRTQKLIMPFDKLFIKVMSIDQATNQIFNSSDELRYSGSNNGAIGYLVDEAGNIVFPFAGKIKVVGLTTAQAGEKIQKALSEYVANTTIIVNYIDNQVTIMGEVQREGVYPFTQDKLTIYQALALGGGLTRYGNRKNVVLIRQEGDKIYHHVLNLTDSKIANKNYYYVLPNDIVVVEPLRSVSYSYQNITFSTVLTTITTLIAVLLFTGVKL